MGIVIDGARTLETKSPMDDPDRDFFTWSPEQLKRYGIVLPKNGRGTFEEIMALVRSFPPLEDGERDLYETIMEARVERRKHATEKVR